jgi:hypothetical protein
MSVVVESLIQLSQVKPIELQNDLDVLNYICFSYYTRSLKQIDFSNQNDF